LSKIDFLRLRLHVKRAPEGARLLISSFHLAPSPAIYSGRTPPFISAANRLTKVDDVVDGVKSLDKATSAPILFGQARAGTHFSTKPDVPDFLKGKALEDVASGLSSGKLSPDKIPISAFEHQGKLVSANTRGLTALSMAGMKPTNVTIRPPTPQELKRLNETSVLGDTLPAKRIAITPSMKDKTVLKEVHIPE
jgi:hypothetical protein